VTGLFGDVHVDALAGQIYAREGYKETMGSWPPELGYAQLFRKRARQVLDDIAAAGLIAPPEEPGDPALEEQSPVIDASTLLPTRPSGVRHDTSELGQVDVEDPRTAAEQIAGDLRTAIASCRYAPGDAIPGLHDIARHYGVAAETVKSALRTLAAEQLLQGRKGSGTYVRDGASEKARDGNRRNPEVLAEEVAQLREDLDQRLQLLTWMIRELLNRMPFAEPGDPAGVTPAGLDILVTDRRPN
jgi:DNA-binding transcriptional regulator YhcF (GntR family)